MTAAPAMLWAPVMPCWLWTMLTNDDRKYGDMPADIGNGELVACW